MASQAPEVAFPSLVSLYVEPRFDGQSLGSATGFFMRARRGQFMFCTNRHVVTGRHQESGRVLNSQGGIPNELLIRLHSPSGGWIETVTPLFDDEGRSLWVEHPNLGSSADFVGLTRVDARLAKVHFVESVGAPIHVRPASSVSVVGFPFGLDRSGLPIWATGFVASEDEPGEPTFLIDCRTRHGQSGSLVVAHRSDGTYGTGDGIAFADGPATRYLGIYSGRVNEESDLGTVWKIEHLFEMINSFPASDVNTSVRFSFGPPTISPQTPDQA